MSFVRTTARVIVGCVTVPIGVTLGVAGGAVAGAAIGGIAGCAFGWQTAGAIVCDKSLQRKSMAQHNAEVLYSFMPKDMREAAAKAVVEQVLKSPLPQEVAAHAAPSV